MASSSAAPAATVQHPQLDDSAGDDSSDTTQLLANSSGASGDGTVPSRTRQQLRREVTLLDATAMTIGSIIGSGIFSAPGVALAFSNSVGFSLVAWVIGGVMATMSSLVYCELGAMLPAAGGDYVYLTKAFGPRMAFTWAFGQFFVYKPTSLAVSGQIMGRYTAAVLLARSDDRTANGESSSAEKVLAVLFVLFLTGFNVLPVGTVVRISTGLQVVCKPALCIAIVCLAIAFAAHDPTVLSQNFEGAFSGVDVGGMGPAVFASLFAYNGWQNCGQMAEEMRDPQRELPRAIIIAMICVTATYLLLNVAYLSVLPGFGAAGGDSIVATPAIAVSTAQVAARGLGVLVTAAPVAISVLVSVSATGSTNVSIMTAGRSIFAMARAGEAPQIFATLSRWDTPYAALWAQSVPAIALILLPGAGLGTLTTFRETWNWLFFAVVGFAMLRLRRTHPSLPRPYRAPRSSAVICIGASVLVTLSTLWSQPLAALAGFAFVAAGWATHALLLSPSPSASSSH